MVGVHVVTVEKNLSSLLKPPVFKGKKILQILNFLSQYLTGKLSLLTKIIVFSLYTEIAFLFSRPSEGIMNKGKCIKIIPL
jgi:hypothetical protein